MFYILWAPQKAPSTGTPHLQGYVQFKKPKTRGEAVKMLGGKVAVFKSKGSYAQNHAYITQDEKKTNTGPHVERGVPQVDLINTPSQQGLRSDLREAKARMASGENPAAIEEEMPDLWAKYAGYMLSMSLARKPRAPVAWPLRLFGRDVIKPNVAIKKRHWWFWGPPDLGKTRAVGEATKGMAVYWAPPDAKNRFEMYRDEELIIYDDIIPELAELINVSNHSYGQQQRPGGKRYTPGYWQEDSDRTIIVLSNKSPDNWPESFHARFHVVALKPTIFERAARPPAAAPPAPLPGEDDSWGAPPSPGFTATVLEDDYEMWKRTGAFYGTVPDGYEVKF